MYNVTAGFKSEPIVIATANAATTNTGDLANAIAAINNSVAINSEIYGSIFINKEMKYLVVKAVIGFGDRLESLKMYIDYALKNDLIVHIDWRDSIWCHNNETFYKYFQLTDLKQVFSIDEIPTDLRIFPTFWKDKLDTILTEDIIKNNHKEIEHKIIYSILNRKPKRADIYWFVHVDTLDEPYTMDYKVTVIEKDDIIKVNFKLGFRVEQRINLYFRKVVEEMVSRGEVDITSRYKSLNEQNVIGDFRFVVLEKFLSFDNELPLLDRMVMKAYFFVKQFTPSEDKWFGLDSDAVKLEKVPLIIKPVSKCNLRRID